MTPSKSSSRIDSKRSRARAAVLLAGSLFAALFLAAPPIGAQTLKGTLHSSAGHVDATLVFQWDQAAATVESLQKGLEARIVYTVRLYQKSQGLFPFGGDRVVAQATVWRTALWDFLDSVYIVEGEGGSQTVCRTTDELMASFFTARGVPLYDFGTRKHPPLYAMARAQFEPVRLMPPLTLVNLVGAASIVATPWTRIDEP